MPASLAASSSACSRDTALVPSRAPRYETTQLMSAAGAANVPTKSSMLTLLKSATSAKGKTGDNGLSVMARMRTPRR